MAAPPQAPAADCYYAIEGLRHLSAGRVPVASIVLVLVEPTGEFSTLVAIKGFQDRLYPHIERQLRQGKDGNRLRVFVRISLKVWQGSFHVFTALNTVARTLRPLVVNV